MTHVASQRIGRSQARRRSPDRSHRAPSRREASAAASSKSSRVGGLDHHRLAERELVLRQGAGLVGAEHVDAGEFLDGDEARDDRLEPRETLGAHRHRDRQDGRQRDRDRRDGEDQREEQRLDQRIAAKERDDQDQRHEADRAEDEEVADAQDRALEMRDGAGALDKARGLAEIGVHAGRGDHGLHLAELGDRAGIRRIAHLLVDRQRLPGQRRLIDAQIVALDEAHVGRDDVAEADQDDVARDEFARRHFPPAPVAQHAGPQRQALLERGNGGVGLELLPEADAGVERAA